MGDFKKGIYLFLGLGTVVYAALQLFSPPQKIPGISLDEPREIRHFWLSAQENQMVSLADFKDQWILVFFGYMSCPDVCPTTLAFLREEYAGLLELRKYVNVIYASLDPQRDRPELVMDYAKHFDGAFKGYVLNSPNLEGLTKELGVFFEKQNLQPNAPMNYTMAHSDNLYLINPKGQWSAVFKAPFKKGEIALALRNLILAEGV